MKTSINNVTVETLIAEMRTLYNSSDNSIVFYRTYGGFGMFVDNRKFKKLIMGKYGISKSAYRKLISSTRCTRGIPGTFYGTFCRRPLQRRVRTTHMASPKFDRCYCYELSVSAANEVTANTRQVRKSTDIPVSKKSITKKSVSENSVSDESGLPSSVNILTNALLAIREVTKAVGNKSVVDKCITDDLDGLANKMNKVINKIVVRTAQQVLGEFDGSDSSLEDIIEANVIDHIGNGISK